MLAACKPLILLDFHRSFNDTRTMRSVLIGFEYPVMDTPHFYFLQSSYSDLYRGVADSYAFTRFHDDVDFRDLLAVWYFKGSDTVSIQDI